MLYQLLPLFIIGPLTGFVLSLFVPSEREKLISGITFFTSGLHVIASFLFIVWWIYGGANSFNIKEFVIYANSGYEFYIDFYFDEVGAAFLMVGSFLTFLVTIYSRVYLHRDKGYKRFFNTILFFFTGYNIIVISGNLETMFIGWEILGLSSFLLIAFYRDRYLPVKNALKVFSVYRIGDVGIVLAMWASHLLWHENIPFILLQQNELVHHHLQSQSAIGLFISIMFLLAAAAKSAQLPFSSWLPRAMEGPTPSSAIFYGSLSVHLGVFLLLRTFPFWEHQILIRILIGLCGFFTSIICTLIARVQASVKSQIAYSSSAQIGIMFIEIALGFEYLALFHFAGNAFLRTYQLLVSPSVVSYMIKEQFYHFSPRRDTFEDSWPKRVEYAWFLLSMKEFMLDKVMDVLVWKPLKNIGKKLDFLSVNVVISIFIPLYLGGIYIWYFGIQSQLAHAYLPGICAFIGLLMVFKSFSERKSPLLAWVLIIMQYLWTTLAVAFNGTFSFKESIIYVSGAVFAGILGYIILKQLKHKEGKIDLNGFYGHIYEYPGMALLFLLACLGLMGFPITPTFIGVDLVFSHIQYQQLFLAICVTLSFVVTGISLVRLYARIFLGPHIKKYHETSLKSS
ncbi:MAG: hypothetical protein IPK46_06850 [Saprospiraceae bacterium]|nr:hypothetical protein [Saprospiraceae bacterium]